MTDNHLVSELVPPRMCSGFCIDMPVPIPVRQGAHDVMIQGQLSEE